MTGWLRRLGLVLLVASLLGCTPALAFADSPSPSPSSPSGGDSASALPGPEPAAASPTDSGSGSPLVADDRVMVLDWMTAMVWGMGISVLCSSAALVLLVRK